MRLLYLLLIALTLPHAPYSPDLARFPLHVGDPAPADCVFYSTYDEAPTCFRQYDSGPVRFASITAANGRIATLGLTLSDGATMGDMIAVLGRPHQERVGRSYRACWDDARAWVGGPVHRLASPVLYVSLGVEC